MTAREVVARIRSLDRSAGVVHRVGSHQKWLLGDGSIIIVPVHPGDLPAGTIRSIERQGAAALGDRWLRRHHGGVIP